MLSSILRIWCTTFRIWAHRVSFFFCHLLTCQITSKIPNRTAHVQAKMKISVWDFQYWRVDVPLFSSFFDRFRLVIRVWPNKTTKSPKIARITNMNFEIHLPTFPKNSVPAGNKNISNNRIPIPATMMLHTAAAFIQRILHHISILKGTMTINRDELLRRLRKLFYAWSMPEWWRSRRTQTSNVWYSRWYGNGEA